MRNLTRTAQSDQKVQKYKKSKGKCLAFVLSGGGARGGLQVGAIRALLEAGFQPEMLVGTSIGAVNATFLAVHGINLESIPKLVAAWEDAASAELMPSNYLWLSLRAIFNRPMQSISEQMRKFYISHGLSPELRFGDIKGVQLVLVAADLNNGRPVLYGEDPDQSVLEGLIASTTLPPWISPLEIDGNLLMDGGAVSNLPIEPALRFGATEIIALDLLDERGPSTVSPGFSQFLSKLLVTVSKRQVEVELALAAARGVRVRHINLVGKEPIQLWDFKYAPELMAQGYAITKREIAGWKSAERTIWQRLQDRLRGQGDEKAKKTVHAP